MPELLGSTLEEVAEDACMADQDPERAPYRCTTFAISRTLTPSCCGSGRPAKFPPVPCDPADSCAVYEMVSPPPVPSGHSKS